MARQKAEDKEPPALNLVVTQSAQPYVDLLKLHEPGKHFTEEEENAIVALMAICDSNSGRVQRMTNLPRNSLWDVMERNMGAFVEQRERWKKSFAVKLQDISNNLAEKLAEKVDTEGFSLRDGTVALGIMLQRGMDLAGEGATVTHKHVHSVDRASLEAAMERLRAIRPAQTDDSDVLEADFRVVE